MFVSTQLILYLHALQAPPLPPEDAAAIMTRMAAHVETAAAERRKYVYHQLVRSSLVRSNGEIARRERREYSATPTESRTEKELNKFEGEYRQEKRMVAYSKPGYKYKSLDIDGDLMSELTDDLVNAKDSRDGIPHSLFPLAAKDLPSYRFTMKGKAGIRGRSAYEIEFEPVRKSGCVTVGGDDECGTPPWAGTAWVDVEELQPVRIQTHLAFKVPWAIRTFLGTNIRQTGFSVSYMRAGPNVWFPVTYGTEFQLNLLWGYKRTITLSMENSGFRMTDASSTIEYQAPSP
jgi:hypothetical protein